MRGKTGTPMIIERPRKNDKAPRYKKSTRSFKEAREEAKRLAEGISPL